MAERVASVREVGGQRIHRFQVVRERRNGGHVEDWIVVGFGPGTVKLSDPAFEWHQEFPTAAFREGRVEAVTAGGVPVWGY